MPSYEETIVIGFMFLHFRVKSLELSDRKLEAETLATRWSWILGAAFALMMVGRLYSRFVP